jgi:nucleoside-diphosphate-sugar epimerase
VTGASGWLGRAALEVLSARSGEVVAFASRARTLGQHVLRPLADLPATPHDVLLHYAYATREHAEAMGVDRYVSVNRGITQTVLEALERQRPSAMFFASSGAARAEGTLEDDPYAALKRQDETTFSDAMRGLGGRIAIARVFNVAGPWMPDPKGFALASMIDQVRAGGPLKVRASHPVRRSFVDVEDLAALAVALAGDGPDDVLFETAGDEVVEVGELAERVARVLGNADMSFEREWDPGAPPDDYVGDGALMRELARERGLELRGLDDQIARTAAWMGFRRLASNSRETVETESGDNAR